MTNETNNTLGKAYFTPGRLIAIVAASIFITEAAVMTILFMLPTLPPAIDTFVDATLLVILLSPVLYFFLLRPMIAHVKLREKVEADLRKERDRARMYFDGAGVIMAVLDADGKVNTINRRGCEILGHSTDEILGKNWFESFIPEREREDAKTALMGTGGGFVSHEGYFESPIKARDGSERMVIWSKTRLVEHGGFAGTLLSGEDITERLLIRKALIESETRYRLVHNSAFDAIILSDANDRVIDCNPSAEKMFGFEHGTLAGTELVNLMPEKYRGPHTAGLKRFLARGSSAIQGKVLELEGLRKNGEVFPIELVLSSFNIGGVIHFTGTVRDITERRKAEKEKETIQSQLNQAQKIDAVGRLAGGIAHDFNNILMSIRGNAELAIEDMGKDSPLYPRLHEITSSVLFASKLTRQLLLFSRSHPHEVVPLDMNKTIENILVMLKRLIGEQTQIKTVLAQDIRTIRADEGNIEQVILNLAINARDAMQEGGTITMSTANVRLDPVSCKTLAGVKPGNYVSLTVADTGSGMDKEILNRIFEPFFTTKEPGKGTGLGLSVVYGIVKQHGGCIDVDSRPGKGTRFTVYLPAEGETSRERTAPSGRAQRVGGEKILLVENDPGARAAAREILLENGYLVEEAASAREAFNIFNQEMHIFSVVLTRMSLPDMSGVSLVDELKRLNPDLQVLLTNGALDDKIRDEVITRHGYGFLQKPYSAAELLAAIKAALAQAKGDGLND